MRSARRISRFSFGNEMYSISMSLHSSSVIPSSISDSSNMPAPFCTRVDELIRALRRRDVRRASGWRQDSVRMTSGWRQDGVRMASGRRQDGVRMRQDRRQDAVRMMGSLVSGWHQVASGCVRMASGKRQNSIRMASGSIRVASGWRQDGIRISWWRQDGVRKASR